MPYLYALELLALLGCLWRIGSKIAAVAAEVRKLGGNDDDDGE